MDKIKEIFQEFFYLRQEIDSIKDSLEEHRERMIEICEIINNLTEKEPFYEQENSSTYNYEKPTYKTDNTTDITRFKLLKPQNLLISTGNQGVPTDRQTNRQTDRHIQNQVKITQNPIDNAVEILDSLDSIKKEIRLKFKRLTEKEIIIFSTMYQLDEERGYSDYKILSERLNLSESSIRDYIGRLIKKGIPIDKKKINNKNIQLSISQNLKKIAPLSTILQLRDI